LVLGHTADPKPLECSLELSWIHVAGSVAVEEFEGLAEAKGPASRSLEQLTSDVLLHALDGHAAADLAVCFAIDDLSL